MVLWGGRKYVYVWGRKRMRETIGTRRTHRERERGRERKSGSGPQPMLYNHISNSFGVRYLSIFKF